MPKKNVKCVPYNSEDCYNLEEVTEDQKKVKAKDVFDSYTPPKKSKDNKKNNKANKKSKKTKPKGRVPKGSHRMPDGSIMKNSDMKKKKKY